MNKSFLSDEGRSYIPIYIKPCDETVLSPVRFKVDTGADLTTISKQTLKQLGYSLDWIDQNAVESASQTITRAGGHPRPACFVQIDIANILGRELMNWPFFVRREHHLDYPNLLGLNLLSYFDFRFNYSDWTFEIAHIPKPKIIFSMLPNQAIHELFQRPV